jgi:hypothetical protein
MIIKMVIWGLQLVSFAFLFYGTLKIRKIVLGNPAMSRQIDTNTMLLTLICVSIVLALYVGIYVMMIFIANSDQDAAPVNQDTNGSELDVDTVA